MKLLIATDHTFLQNPTGVFDTYCFDWAFFHDYLQVFDSVQVISRMQPCSVLPEGAFRSDGSRVNFLGVSNIRRMRWILFAKYISDLTLRSAVQRADALVARVPSKLGNLAAKLARQMGKPYMIEVIGDPKTALSSSGNGLYYKVAAWLEAKQLKSVARDADVGSYVSKTCLADAYPLAPGKPIDYISSIRLDSGEITTPRVFAEKKILNVIHVGSLTPRKRCADLVRACHKVKQHGVAPRVHLVGAGAERSALERLAYKLDVSTDVIFHGHVSDRQQLRSLLDSSDLFAMPTASEGLPRAIIEAMARGLPAIGTRTPGVDELVRGTETFSVGDVDALAALLINLAGDPARLTEMSWHSIVTAKQYTNEILSPKRQYLYQKLRASVIT